MWHACSTLTPGQSPALTYILYLFSTKNPPFLFFVRVRGEPGNEDTSLYTALKAHKSEMYLNIFCVCFIAACKLKSKYACTDKQNTLNTCVSEYGPNTWQPLNTCRQNSSIKEIYSPLGKKPCRMVSLTLNTREYLPPQLC